MTISERISKQLAKNWAAVIALTCVCSYVMKTVDFPAAALLGAMLAAIAVGLRSGGMRLPPRMFNAAQGIIGMMIGLQMPDGFFTQIRHSWPMFAGGVAWAVVASSAMGWLLTKWRLFPGTTAIWGMSPGAATSMTIMSESYGGDIRIVAFMQYFRNTSVVVVTSIVAKIWVDSTEAPISASDWLSTPPAHSFFLTLAVIFAALAVAKKLRVPGGQILIPMFTGMFFKYTGALPLAMPQWLMSSASVLVGWSIGLRFNKPVLKQIAHALPGICGAVLTMILVCGLFSVFMWWQADIDPLTAYLAACPGGLDSVAIIAASAHVDVAFVLAMHSSRFILVVLTAPFIARQIVKRVRRKEGLTQEGESRA